MCDFYETLAHLYFLQKLYEKENKEITIIDVSYTVNFFQCI